MIVICLLALGFSFSSTAQITKQQLLEKLQKREKEGSRKDKIKHEELMLNGPNGERLTRGQELLFAHKMNAGKRSRSQNLIPVENWKQRGPFNVGGRTRALAIDRTNEQTLLAGGVSGGMWRSTDGGASWSKVTGVSEVQSVTDIYQDPNNTNVWYYVTGEAVGNTAGTFGAGFFGSGVFKSTDGGITWVLLPSTTNNNPTTVNNVFQLNFRVRVHPTTSDVYVAGLGGIKRSTDGGTTWSTVLPGGGSSLNDIEVSDNGVLYATIQSSGTPNNGIFRSTDGTNWTSITPAALPANFARIVLDIAKSDENIVYFFAATAGAGVSGHSLFKYVYTSGEGNGDGTVGNGGVWTDLTANLPSFGGDVGDLAQANYNQYIKIKPDDANAIFIGSLNIYRSTNGFADASTNAWIAGYSPLNNVSLYTNHHPDNHSMVFYPSNPNRVITGHDGGLSRTENILQNDTTTVEPVTWESLNNGYFTTQPYAISIDPVVANDNRIIAGFQDNATWMTTSKASDAIWRSLESGDGSYNAIEPNSNIRYVSSQRGRTLRQEEGDTTNAFNFVTPLAAKVFLFINPYALDRTNYKRMYFLADGGVYRNPDLDDKRFFFNFPDGRPVFAYTNWERLDSTFLGINFFTSALDVGVDGTLYYGKAGGGEIYKVPNASVGQPGTVDIFTGKGLPNGSVSSITADPVDSNKVYATFSNYGIPSIFYTENGGDTWVDVSGNLEENPDGTGNGPSVRWMTVHRPVTGAPIYFVGTSIGLFSTTRLDGANTVWNQEGGDVIGNVVTMMVRTRASDGLVAIATHGNGVYSANLVNVSCEEAQHLNANNLTRNSATLNWDAVYTAQNYDVRYRLKGDTLWTTENGLSTTSLDISELTSGCQYEFQVRANCLYGSSDFGAAKMFQTYCTPYVHSGFFFSKVKFAGIKNVSYPTYGGDTFQEFTDQVATVTQGGRYKLKLKSQFRKRYQVWIDYNHDGDFNDAGEKVYQSRGFFFGEKKAKTWVKVPANAQVGKTRMRVVMRTFFRSRNACEDMFFGKIEDYTIDIQGVGSIAARNANFDVETQFKAFPNPVTSGTTTITGQVEEESNVTILLVDVATGVGLRRKAVYTASGNINEKINLNGLKPGVYVLNIISGDTKKVIKLLLQ